MNTGDDIPNRRISRVEFYVMGSESNRTTGRVEVTSKDVTKNEIPVPSGVYDARMGTTDNGWNCASCLNKKSQCPGHFGFINTNYPLIQPLMHAEVVRWLKVVCHNCGSPIVDAKSLDIAIIKAKAPKLTNCSICQHELYTVSQTNVIGKINRTSRVDTKHETEMLNHQIQEILKKISSATCLQFGKQLGSHPSNFVVNTILVPPNTTRPDIRRTNGIRTSHSDITSLIKSIVGVNQSLPKNVPPLNQISPELNTAYSLLQLHYNALIKPGNSNVKIGTGGNKPVISITESWNGKEGFIRKYLNGKRVTFMIRAVITGDPTLQIDQLGVPISHAQSLEAEEYVTAENKQRLMIYFNNRDVYPGCSRIQKASDGQVYITKHILDYTLQIGDIVYRNLIDGDWVCLNRQPSLTITSIAGMHIKIMKEGDTLRFNPTICKYFNADFDGDAMNALVPQSLAASMECKYISQVARWAISPIKQNPQVGMFQDALVGAMEMSKNMTVDKWHAMMIMRAANMRHINLNFNKQKYTTRELISLLLPETLNYERKPLMYRKEYAPFLKYDPSDISVKIVNGQLLGGLLDSESIGQGVSGSLFHSLIHEYGSKFTLDLIYNWQQVANDFLLYHCVTTGIEDINTSEEVLKKVKDRIENMMVESKRITDNLNNGKLIAPLGVDLADFYEECQLSALGHGDDIMYPILADINFEANAIFRLILCGSKGKLPNFFSLNGAIGQQTVDGKRAEPQCGYARVSPYYQRYDSSPKASGYVSMSYREGASNDAYVAMASESRFGLATTAMATSITGTQYRISAKNMDPITINNKFAATKGNKIVQMLFGENGMDPAKMKKVTFPTIAISNSKFLEYKANVADFPTYAKSKDLTKLLEDEFATLKRDRDEYRNVHFELERYNPKEYVMGDRKYIPTDVSHIIEKIKQMSKSLNLPSENLDPFAAVKVVTDLCHDLGYCYLNEIQRANKTPIPKHFVMATQLTCIFIRSKLCLKQLLLHEINNKLLTMICNEVYIVYKSCLIDYGVCVGIIAAQSVGEPMTQYVLDSRHRVGGQGGTKTNAITRIQEIMSTKSTKNMKNPHTIIILKKDYQNKKRAREIANKIEMMRMGDFVSKVSIFYENYLQAEHPDYVHENKIFEQIHKHRGLKKPNNLAKWCIRYVINKEELIIKSMQLETMIFELNRKFPELFMIYTPENSDVIIIRCYIITTTLKSYKNSFLDEYLVKLVARMFGTIVRGVKDIINATVIEYSKTIVDEDGSLKQVKVPAILTSGTNLREIMLIEGVDTYNTQSDSIVEIYEIFGITAARNKIINEMSLVLNTNNCYSSLIADEMSSCAFLSRIQRTGLEERGSQVHHRMSFQSTVQVIQKAGINSTVDYIENDVSGPLLIGSIPLIGTSANRLLINSDFIAEQAKNISDIADNL